MSKPEELLEQTQADLEAVDFDEEAFGIDRRHFVLLSLAAAAATALGAEPAVGQEERPALGGVAPAQVPPQRRPPVPLGNGEPPALQFQPYPGGTGALMEKLVRERGAHAFDRGTYEPEAWTGPVPTSDEAIAFLPAHRLSALLKAGHITSARLTDIYLGRLKRLNPKLLCAVTIMEEQARAAAARADAEMAAGKYRGPLHGLPYGVKDLFATKGVPTTWGAKDFEHRIIDEDAEVVVRLRDAGAVLIAKLATGLFAQNDQWFRGRTNNPWNLTQGSSGSSAGPASATAAGCVAFGIGTETSGSIVSPTIRCGLSAIRPTFGRVSRYGGMVLAWSQDRVGAITRTSEDAAMVFNVIHGVDEKDPSTVTMPFQFRRGIDLSSLRIGVDDQAPEELVSKLRDLGMKPVSIGRRPTVPGMGRGGLAVEDAAAFDFYVQRKAKEIGLDLNNLPPLPSRGGRAGEGARRGGGAAGRGGGGAGRGRAPANPMAPADWNPRFVYGRRIPGFEFLQTERRRYIMIRKWAEFLKDLDMYIGSPFADIGATAQTGNPSAVLPYKFAVPRPFRGRGRGGGQAPPPEPELDPQPICGQIIGNLYNDDLILAVAHQFQIHDETVDRHPTL